LSHRTIQEADGTRDHTFWLRNAGQEVAVVQQCYTSCGCTTISTLDGNRFEGTSIQPGDSAAVMLHFNPRGKGGEFEERATIVYGTARKHVSMSLTGNCISSEESLLRQFPVRVSDKVRLSTDRFDLGIMHVGETKERGVVVLFVDDQRQLRIPISFTPDANTPKGLQHIAYPLSPPASTSEAASNSVSSEATSVPIIITLDVIVR